MAVGKRPTAPFMAPRSPLSINCTGACRNHTGVCIFVVATVSYGRKSKGLDVSAGQANRQNGFIWMKRLGKEVRRQGQRADIF